MELNRVQCLVSDDDAMAQFKNYHDILGDVLIERLDPNEEAAIVQKHGDRIPVRTWIIHQARLRSHGIGKFEPGMIVYELFLGQTRDTGTVRPYGAINLQAPNSDKLRLPPFRSKVISLVDSDEDVTEVGIGKNGPWSYKNECIYVDLMDEDVKNYNRVGWCPIKGTVDATEEMWNRLYKINSKAKSFRKCGYPHYAAMTRVLGDNTAKGMNAFASTQSPSRTDSSDPEFKIKDEADIEDLEVKEKGQTIKPKAISNSRKRDSYSANLSASLNVLAESSHGLSYSKAMTKLKEDPTWRPIFLGIPDKRKMDWCTSLP
ncbi:hypothetical protein Acr_00g0038870 [Actinidia rufa]|uniref:Uncharacterized protein n=1 Tax=Actinidia rufa TaxID=165716 RepID=A0A7J0DHM2_9ERIC|nr:hypothetical protein Acr_00g0038870 [Actinidia rufa]